LRRDVLGVQKQRLALRKEVDERLKFVVRIHSVPNRQKAGERPIGAAARRPVHGERAV